MFIPFDQLPDNARVWIYPSSRKFFPDEVLVIRQKTKAFLEQWTAHGTELQAGLDLPYHRFIVLGLNESIQSASGCSIDASVHFIQSLEETFKITLLDKMNVTFRNKNAIDHISLKEFQTKAKEKKVNSDVIVFNNLVQNKMEYDSLWEVPASSSWHARYF
ncbi:MAG: ABC transporter ATPase [Bacteroidota bacterium]|nr:ABC transporter ATPase [Bacteroidota bacterium]